VDASGVDLLPRLDGEGDLAEVGTVTVGPPLADPSAPSALPALRLPIQHALGDPAPHGPLRLLGYTGPDATTPVLAGTPASLTLFWQGQAAWASPGDAAESFYVVLAAEGAAGLFHAGAFGWPNGPVDVGPGALAQARTSVQLPGNVETGLYELAAGLVWADGSRTPPTPLGQVAVVQRTGRFAPITPTQPFGPAMRFGTHALLLGYDLAVQVEAGETGERGEILLDLGLVWQVEQPLLPPHQLFVHVDGPDGTRLAQADVMPNDEGTGVPTGSWQPGEFFRHRQVVRLPGDALDLGGPLVLRVGLYVPETGVRLPVSQGDVVLGDSVTIPMPAP
jgi:hypothetical protein